MATMATPDPYREYWDAIVQRVCGVCLDQADDGGCGLAHRMCALQRHLPLVVESIASIDSPRMDEYVAAIEARVCGRCDLSAADGSCRLRERGDCALPTYLSLVVEAIEDVRARS
jgi:hypothetical protein